ncbi:muscarinic acetylcholine receptor M1-like [Asterias rubens]|uniref:muscarinic acetylcholine receptor M1-like n=1 Tax=Asterias rubens TaxID=7604 RepID=UPI0014555294|nr:muscarinic acetylcholine receptor M1-like [Asterias rubens]
MKNSSGSTLTEAGSDYDIGVTVCQLMYHIIVVFFGVPGNCLILRVYWTKTLKTSTHVLIMGLAWADLAVCLLHILGISERILHLAGSAAPLWVTVLISFQYIALGTSSVLTGVIAADRYDCICRPQRRFFTHRRGKIAVLASLVLSFLMNIPGFFASSSNFSNPFEVELVFALQFAKFVFVLIMIALCYGKVYLTIRKHTRVGALKTTVQEGNGKAGDSEWSTRFPISPGESSQQTSSNTVDTVAISGHILQASLPMEIKSVAGPQPTPGGPCGALPHVQEPTESGPFRNGKSAVLHRKTTLMLFITSLVYLLTWMPYWVYATVLVSYFRGVMVNPSSIGILIEISYVVYINNAVNPLIYGLANRRFRKDCKEVIRKMRL